MVEQIEPVFGTKATCPTCPQPTQLYYRRLPNTKSRNFPSGFHIWSYGTMALYKNLYIIFGFASNHKGSINKAWREGAQNYRRSL